MRSKRIQDKKEEKKVVKEKTNVKKKAVKEKTKVKKSAVTGIATGRVTRRTVVVAAPRRTIQKRKKYNSSALHGALKTLQDTNLALRRVSDAYGIPLSTLHRKNKNPDDCDKKSGNGPVLGKEVEDEIAKWIKYRAQTGHPVTKNQLLDAIDSYVKIMKLKTPFTEDRPGRSWFSGFRQRYSDLAIRKTQQLSHTRAEVFREDIEGWFAEIQKYLDKKSLTNISADRIFNCDETSVAVCPKGENVITLKGARTVYTICDADKACFTALFMYNAAGTRAPPMVMYNYQDDVPQSILTNSPEGWGTGLSDNGWMTAESFYGYICNVFYPWLLKQNIEFPVIIYADNHASHFNIPLVTFCRERQIELLGLIPNSTHIIQPLDISFFKSFKESWRKSVPKWKKENSEPKLKKEHYAQVIKYALHNMPNEKENIKSGFKSAGLSPFSPKAVNFNIFSKQGKTAKRKTENQVQDSNKQESPKENEQLNVQILRHVENGLSQDILEEFELSRASGLWKGVTEFKAHFDYWLKLKNSISTSTSTSSFNACENVEIATLNSNIAEKMNSDNSFELQPVLDERGQPIHIAESDENLQTISHDIVLQNIEVTDNFSQQLIHNDAEFDTTESIITIIAVQNEENVYTSVNIPMDEGNDFIDENARMEFRLNDEPHDFVENLLPRTCGSDTSISKTCAQRSPTVSHKKISEITENNVYMDYNCNNEPLDFSTCIKKLSPAKSGKKLNGKVNGKANGKVNEQLDKENCSALINQAESNTSKSSLTPFQKIFTYPKEYLPKKRQQKIDATGKPEPPLVAGTNDMWMDYKLGILNEKKEKEFKAQEKKRLQELKKEVTLTKTPILEKIKFIELKMIRATETEKVTLQREKKEAEEEKKKIELEIKNIQQEINCITSIVKKEKKK